MAVCHNRQSVTSKFFILTTSFYFSGSQAKRQRRQQQILSPSQFGMPFLAGIKKKFHRNATESGAKRTERTH